MYKQAGVVHILYTCLIPAMLFESAYKGIVSLDIGFNFRVGKIYSALSIAPISFFHFVLPSS
jgi:hypothetical protein